MSQLVSTLRSVLEEGDGHMAAQRPSRARSSYERLLERAQERADRPMAIIARAMLARIAVTRRALEEAADLLDQAEPLLDPDHHESQGRHRASQVRLLIAQPGPPPTEALRAYFDWSEQHERWEELVDASALLAEQASSAMDAIQWLERAIDTAQLHGVESRLGSLYTHLASLQERDGSAQEALRAHQSARTWHDKHGTAHDRVAARWAVGASALLLEDWPLAQQSLEEALSLGEPEPDSQTLLPVILADLATAYAASGDVVEAQRMLTRALKGAREHDLASWWPERWVAMSRQADDLDARL